MATTDRWLRAVFRRRTTCIVSSNWPVIRATIKEQICEPKQRASAPKFEVQTTVLALYRCFAICGLFVSIVSLGLATGIGPVFGQSSAASFSDLGNYAEERPAIERIVALGIMRGASATIFAPDSPMTRGDFVIALQKMFQLPPPARPVVVTDVSPDDPLYSAVQAAQPYLGRQLLCPGCALISNFLRNLPITAGEQTIALVRVLVARNRVQLLSPAETAAALADVKDSASAPRLAAPYFATALKSGLLTLGPDKTLRLTTTPTRLNVAVTLDALQQKFAIPAVKSSP
jgi:hypothetical protein